MSIQDPIAEAADEIVSNPNKKAKTAQGLRYIAIAGTAAVIGCGVLYMTVFKPAPGTHGAKATAPLQQRDITTAQVGSPAAVSPGAENVQLRAQIADLTSKYNQVQQQNAELTNQNEGIAQQVAIQQAQASNGTRSAGGSLTAPSRGSSGGVGAIPQISQASTSPIYNPTGTAQVALEAPPPPAKRTMKIGWITGEQAKPDAGKSSGGAGGSDGGVTGVGKKGTAIDDVVVYDGTQYVAPNSYVSATVLVGVDMTTGVGGSQDPKPVLLRITGNTQGVGMDGKFQSTNLTGCMVNGAAYAELSSEKVYIKAERITCPAGDGQFMTSKVEGFVTYKGKAGVRGRVVSREGDYANKAFVAGTLQGLGQAMSTNVQRTISGVGTGAGGGATISTDPLTGSQITQSAIGSGVGNGATMMAQYYIQRAEQYQPVIEMPTGVNVEIVFLEGFRTTNKVK